MNWSALKEILNLLKRTDLYIISVLLSLFLISSCGLPNYEVLEAPTVYSPPGSSTVGFETPGDDTIDGYIIYYKIYYYGDTQIDDDEDQFDESYYSNDDLPSGTSVPESLDFYNLGFVDDTSNTSYPHIPLTGSSHQVYFDFSQTLLRLDDPELYIDSTSYNSAIGIPARGVTYDDVYNSGDNTFKRFLKNYEFDPYLDADLVSMKSSAGTLTDGMSVEIAFVAISYGISPDSFDQLMSVPVYLGTIELTSIYDNSANSRDDS